MIENVLMHIFLVTVIIVLLAHLVVLIVSEIRLERNLREFEELKRELLEEGEADA